MRKEIQQGPFLALFAETGTDVPENYANNIVNVRVKDGRIKPRYGYRNLQAKQGAFANVYGFELLLGYDGSYNAQEEWVSIEDLGNGPQPFHVDKTTGARTIITNNGASVQLGVNGEWHGAAFNFTSYWTNPKASPSLYKHTLNSNTSWDTVGTSIVTPVTTNKLTYNSFLSAYTDLSESMSGQAAVTAVITSGNPGTVTGAQFIAVNGSTTLGPI